VPRKKSRSTSHQTCLHRDKAVLLQDRILLRSKTGADLLDTLAGSLTTEGDVGDCVPRVPNPHQQEPDTNRRNQQ